MSINMQWLISLASLQNSTTSIPNTLSSTPSTPPPLPNQTTSSNSTSTETELHESPYTLPNLITSLRILSCPLLGYLIVNGEMGWAVGLLGVAGWSDWVSFEDLFAAAKERKKDGSFSFSSANFAYRTSDAFEFI